MTIDEAIEILSQDITWTYPAKFTDLQDAIKLGIKALKREKHGRVQQPLIVIRLLPGETKD